jgi:predicted nucleic acid-binding protein
MTNSLVCADANLALKLVLHERGSALARALWEDWNSQGLSVIAPTLWAYEVTSVIRKRAHRGQLTSEVEADAWAAVHQLPVQLMRPAELHRRAWELARRFNLPAAYDAHYLALAAMTPCPFWTADERLFNRVRDELKWVHWLGHFQTTSSSTEES